MAHTVSFSVFTKPWPHKSIDELGHFVHWLGFDGIEHIGRLWFAEKGSIDSALPDRAAIPGRTRDAVLEFAHSLTPDELALRHRRALVEKRRFLQLRRVTDDILTKINAD